MQAVDSNFNFRDDGIISQMHVSSTVVYSCVVRRRDVIIEYNAIRDLAKSYNKLL